MRLISGFALAGLLLAAGATATAAQTGAVDGEWRVFGGDQGATRYSPLDQIDASNVADLEVAWRWTARNFGSSPPGARMQVSPIVVDGVMYTTAGNQRDVVAIDAATGETIWTWRATGVLRRWADIIEPLTSSAGRGLSFWTDWAADRRIFVVTPSYQLVALDAATGYQIADFGQGGFIDMVEDLRWDARPGAQREGRVSNSSPPAIVGDVLVASISMHTGSIPTRTSANEVWPMSVPGDVVAYDVRTGERRWRFNTVPAAGELGVDTWEQADPSVWDIPAGAHAWVTDEPQLLEASWMYTGNVGHWAPVTGDPELGLFYVPTETATNDYFGGYRPGDNLFANSVLALDAQTGERVWHYQLTHHELWDYDIPAAPILVDITVDGVPIKALVQLSKQGFAYVLDRETGEPVWPIVERAVPPSDVPGERASRTQPFPTRPPPFERQGITEDDLIDFTPELRAEAMSIVSEYRIGPLYTPPSLVDADNQGTLILPGIGGGANWPSGAADAESGLLFIPSVTSPTRLGLVDGSDGTGIRYHVAESRAAPNVRGLPLVKPPYGRITAIDLTRGEILWQVPHGDTPDYVSEHPDLQGLELPRTGRPTRGTGLLVTATLLFSGQGARGAPVLAAYDKLTGEAVSDIQLPGGGTIGFPITYEVDGRQYLVVAAVDEDFTAEFVAFALPR